MFIRGVLGGTLVLTKCLREMNINGKSLVDLIDNGYRDASRWGIGIDLPDNSVCIADSKSLHCVTPIRGSGKRFTTVCYTDLSAATIPPLGKPERLIGRFAEMETA